MDKELDKQNQARDQVQEETQRVKEERSIHIQVKNGNSQQRKAQENFGALEGTSVCHRAHGEI